MEGVDASREECPARPLDARLRRPLHNRHSRAGENRTTVIPAQAGIQGWGSPLGILAISATLSPTGGVTQRSPSAGMTVGCGGLPEGVDGRVWMPRQGGRRRVRMPPERSAPPDHWMPAFAGMTSALWWPRQGGRRRVWMLPERSAPPDHWMPAFAGMTVGCGGLPEGVDCRVWMPRRGGCGCLPRGVPRQTTGCPLPETFAQPSFPRRRESRVGGSPLGILAISATLSPTGGVTQTSPSAGMTVALWWLRQGG